MSTLILKMQDAVFQAPTARLRKRELSSMETQQTGKGGQTDGFHIFRKRCFDCVYRKHIVDIELWQQITDCLLRWPANKTSPSLQLTNEKAGNCDSVTLRIV